MPRHAVGDDRVVGHLEARHIGDLAAAVEKPRHAVFRLAAELLVVAELGRSLGRVAQHPAAAVHGYVVGAERDGVPLVLEPPKAPEVPLQAHLVLELLLDGRQSVVARRNGADEAVAVRQRLGPIGSSETGPHERVAHVDGGAVVQADEALRQDVVVAAAAGIELHRLFAARHGRAQAQVAELFGSRVWRGVNADGHLDSAQPGPVGPGHHGWIRGSLVGRLRSGGRYDPLPLLRLAAIARAGAQQHGRERNEQSFALGKQSSVHDPAGAHKNAAGAKFQTRLEAPEARSDSRPRAPGDPQRRP